MNRDEGEVEGCKKKMVKEEKGIGNAYCSTENVSQKCRVHCVTTKESMLTKGLWVVLYWLHKAGKSKLFF